MTKYLSSRLYHLEQQVADFNAQQRRQALQEFSEQLIADGKLSRSDQPSIVEFMVSLPEEQSTYFREFLSDRPQVPEYTLSPQLQIAYSKARNAYEAGWKRGEL